MADSNHYDTLHIHPAATSARLQSLSSLGKAYFIPTAIRKQRITSKLFALCGIRGIKDSRQSYDQELSVSLPGVSGNSKGNRPKQYRASTTNRTGC